MKGIAIFLNKIHNVYFTISFPQDKKTLKRVWMFSFLDYFSFTDQRPYCLIYWKKNESLGFWGLFNNQFWIGRLR